MYCCLVVRPLAEHCVVYNDDVIAFILFLLLHHSLSFNLSFRDGFAGAVRLFFLIIDNTTNRFVLKRRFQRWSYHYITHEISGRVIFWLWGLFVAHITSFLTETIGNFWSITSLERVFGG